MQILFIMKTMIKIFDIIRIILCYLTSSGLLSIYAYFFIVALKIGILPNYGHPDPKDIFKHSDIFFIFFIFSFLVMFIVLIFNLIKIFFNIRKKARVIDFPMMYYFIFFILTIIQMYFDPMGVLDWLAD